MCSVPYTVCDYISMNIQYYYPMGVGRGGGEGSNVDASKNLRCQRNAMLLFHVDCWCQRFLFLGQLTPLMANNIYSINTN